MSSMDDPDVRIAEQIDADARGCALYDCHRGIYDYDPSLHPEKGYFWLQAYERHMKAIGPGFREFREAEQRAALDRIGKTKEKQR